MIKAHAVYSLSVISDAMALYELVSKKWEQYHILGALFKWDGTRIEGDEQLSVQIHKAADNEKAWYYSVKDIPEYVFIRIPVNAGGVLENLGSPGDGPDSKYFRYIAVPDGRI